MKEGYERFAYCFVSGKKISNKKAFHINKECLKNYKGKDGNAGKCIYCINLRYTKPALHFHKRKEPKKAEEKEK